MKLIKIQVEALGSWSNTKTNAMYDKKFRKVLVIFGIKIPITKWINK